MELGYGLEETGWNGNKWITSLRVVNIQYFKFRAHWLSYFITSRAVHVRAYVLLLTSEMDFLISTMNVTI